MTPAEHYAEAERYLGLAQPLDQESEEQDAALSFAMVHATLATIDPDVLWPLARKLSELQPTISGSLVLAKDDQWFWQAGGSQGYADTVDEAASQALEANPGVGIRWNEL